MITTGLYEKAITMRLFVVSIFLLAMIIDTGVQAFGVRQYIPRTQAYEARKAKRERQHQTDSEALQKIDLRGSLDGIRPEDHYETGRGSVRDRILRRGTHDERIKQAELNYRRIFRDSEANHDTSLSEYYAGKLATAKQAYADAVKAAAVAAGREAERVKHYEKDATRGRRATRFLAGQKGIAAYDGVDGYIKARRGMRFNPSKYATLHIVCPFNKSPKPGLDSDVFNTKCNMYFVGTGQAPPKSVMEQDLSSIRAATRRHQTMTHPQRGGGHAYDSPAPTRMPRSSSRMGFGSPHESHVSTRMRESIPQRRFGQSHESPT